jgi:hypothetical protein
MSVTQPSIFQQRVMVARQFGNTSAQASVTYSENPFLNSRKDSRKERSPDCQNPQQACSNLPLGSSNLHADAPLRAPCTASQMQQAPPFCARALWQAFPQTPSWPLLPCLGAHASATVLLVHRHRSQLCKREEAWARPIQATPKQGAPRGALSLDPPG